MAPPLAERLLDRHGPGTVIPLALFTIGAGFAYMHLVIASAYASWIALLPGCILAGLGLGLTNTPVSNTATAALPPERAGMASGTDMSARMVSLASNIALMGLILFSGVSSYLQAVLPQGQSAEALRTLADAISAGNVSRKDAYGLSGTAAREALAHGMGWVTLHGAIAAIALAALSFAVFGRRDAMRH